MAFCRHDLSYKAFRTYLLKLLLTFEIFEFILYLYANEINVSLKM